MKEAKKIRLLSLRILAVICSFILWIYVLSSAQTQIEKKVIIKYSLPESYAILNNVAQYVSYTLKGPRAIVRNVMKKDMTIELNVNHIFQKTQLEYEMSVEDAAISLPFGVQIINFKPKTIKIQLDQQLVKNVPVGLKALGSLPKDQKLIKTSLEPKFITLKGPKKVIETINEVYSCPFDWSKTTQSGSAILDLNTVDKRIEYSQDIVKLEYETQPTRANIHIKNVPINILTKRVFTSVDSRFVNLMVLADNGSNIDLKKREIQIIAKIPDDAQEQVEVELKAQLPEGLQLLKMSPRKVKINLKLEN